METGGSASLLREVSPGREGDDERGASPDREGDDERGASPGREGDDERGPSPGRDGDEARGEAPPATEGAVTSTGEGRSPENGALAPSASAGSAGAGTASGEEARAAAIASLADITSTRGRRSSAEGASSDSSVSSGGEDSGGADGRSAEGREAGGKLPRYVRSAPVCSLRTRTSAPSLRSWRTRDWTTAGVALRFTRTGTLRTRRRPSSTGMPKNSATRAATSSGSESGGTRPPPR
ncbi:MAG: hypothetical protein R3B70_18450 [Polyangiaceae bacterium]